MFIIVPITVTNYDHIGTCFYCGKYVYDEDYTEIAGWGFIDNPFTCYHMECFQIFEECDLSDIYQL